ncbi:MAG: hypothetical protein GY883_11530 [Shimia sp.]|nr:hypothetical protein [Shimia sp.]
MKSLALAAAGLSALVVTHAAAAEFTGGEIQLSYSQFAQDQGGLTLSKTSLDTSVEYGFSRNVGMQFDLGTKYYGASSSSGYAVAMHGQYHVNDNATLGVFIGQDGFSSGTVMFAGVEAGIETNRMSLEAFAMSDIEDNSNGRILGLSADYDINGIWKVTGNLESGNYGGGNAEISRYSVGVRYETGSRFAFTADIGAARGVSLGVSSNDTFFAIGGQWTMGTKRGTTFGSRSLLSPIPGL